VPKRIVILAASDSVAATLSGTRRDPHDIGPVGIQNRPFGLGHHDAGPRRRLEGRGERTGVVAEHDALPVGGHDHIAVDGHVIRYEPCLSGWRPNLLPVGGCDFFA